MRMLTMSESDDNAEISLSGESSTFYFVVPWSFSKSKTDKYHASKVSMYISCMYNAQIKYACTSEPMLEGRNVLRSNMIYIGQEQVCGLLGRALGRF